MTDESKPAHGKQAPPKHPAPVAPPAAPAEIDDALAAEVAAEMAPEVRGELDSRIAAHPHLRQQMQAAGYMPPKAEGQPEDGNDRLAGMAPAVQFVKDSILDNILPIAVKLVVAMLRKRGWTIEPPATAGA